MADGAGLRTEPSDERKTDPTYRAMVYGYGVEGTGQISIIGKIVWYCIPFDFEI